MFSIIIPTFNNLEYLKLCLHSIKKNSLYDHEIIIHVNDDGYGFKNEIIDQIGKPYISKKEKGMGLGIFIARFDTSASHAESSILKIEVKNLIFTDLQYSINSYRGRRSFWNYR